MNPDSPVVIDVRGLVKRFGPLTAVAGIEFDVRQGEIFGFLGPNGAGKTTTVRMLTGVLEPTEGTATIEDHDIRAEGLLSRAHLAVVPEEANVYLDLTLWQNVMLIGQLYGVPRPERTRHAKELLDALGLLDRRRQKARALSKGLRQRLLLCTALIARPEILFLDEPTSGLDVQSARLIRGIVRKLNDGGLTVFLTTHNMDEAEEMCSRVAIIDEGRIVAIDEPGRLRSAIQSSQYVEVAFGGGPPDAAALGRLPGVSRVGSDDGPVRLYTESPGRVAGEVARFAAENGLEIGHLCTRKPSLEDVFLSFTGEQKEGANR
ncbi:MAG: ATP-binding cassette domain-containing protein [Planctomycetota bacterium]